MKLEDLKPGDVFLCLPIPLREHNGWISQAIVKLTRGKVSHTALYCGKDENGVPRVAHSDLRGTIYMSLKQLMDEEPGCFVRRHREQTDLTPVLEAAENYADKGNPYPRTSLGVLGILLIANRFSKDTIKNRIFYDFVLLVSVEIMKIVNEHLHPGKNPMICSQFAAQCFTDAGEAYDIKFKKLLLQFKTNALQQNNEASLLDYVGIDEENNELQDLDETYVLENKDKVIDDFLSSMQDGQLTSTQDVVNDQKLSGVAKKLINAMYKILTGKHPATIEEAIKAFSTNRNYLVTPDDLLSNTKNLDDKGFFDKTIFA